MNNWKLSLNEWIIPNLLADVEIVRQAAFNVIRTGGIMLKLDRMYIALRWNEIIIYRYHKFNTNMKIPSV